MKPVTPGFRKLAIAAGLVVLFTVTGFFILPPIAKSQLEKRASAALGRKVTVEKVRLNPYALSLTLENFLIREADGTSAFLGWKRLYVNFDALSSLWSEWVLAAIELDGFDVRATLNRDQSFNFSDILARLAPPPGAPLPPPSEPGRPVRIGSLKVTDARAVFADASRRQPFATTLGPLTFSLTEFRTVSEQGAPYRFEAVTEANERLAWSGTLQAQPPHSSGELRLDDIVLAKYAPYYADQVQADIAAGTLSVRGKYDVTFDSKERTIKLHDGAVALRGLRLMERGVGEPAFELEQLDVAGIEADGVTLKAKVESVALSGGRVRVRREKDGALNLLTMLQPPAPNAPTPVPPTPAPAPVAPLPEVLVSDVSVKGFQVQVTDLAAARPAQLALGDLAVSLRNVTLADGAQIPVQLACTWAPQGRIQLAGNVSLKPMRATLKTEVTGLELLPLSPYLEQFANARLTQGAFSTTLEAEATLAEGKPPAATVTGDFTLERFGLVDGAHNEELAGIGSLAIRGIRASTSPETSVSLAEIALTDPYARVVVNADKSLNLAAVAAARSGQTPAATPKSDAPAPTAVEAPAPSANAGATAPKIEIGKVVIAGGDFRFTDRSLQPNVTMAVSQFAGTIAGLSSTNMAKGDLDLKAVVDGAGPIAIAGKLDPLGTKAFLDVKVDFKNVDLVPLSPYSGKFAGYQLARGKLLLDTKVLIDGKKIESTNVLTLNQFTFGAPVKSPDATSLPVRLGVALLKDMDGKIVIDVPVQGNTDDPSFKVGRVVLRVIVNLLTKAAVSPFSLLGAAFGGGGDELAFQEFAPGSVELQPAELKKLETMTKALTNRPGLNLALEGGYDPAADAYALKRVKLADQVRRAVWEAKHAQDPNIPPPEKLVVSAEEHAAMIKKLYDEKFPPGTEFGAPIPPPPAVVTPPQPPPGFFSRLARAITRQAKREQQAAEAENKRRAAEHEKAVAEAVATGVPLDQMTGRLAEAVTVDDNDLRELARLRAQQVRDYFANVGKIAPERLFLASAQPAPAAAATANPTAAQTGKGPRVFLQLQ